MKTESSESTTSRTIIDAFAFVHHESRNFGRKTEAATLCPRTEINRCRIERGFAPYTRDKRLEAAASDRMSDMEELGYWAHVSPDGRSPFSWIPLRGYLFRAAGENLAGGFETAELLVTSWMESKGHRANILSPDFRSVAIAIMDGSPTGRAMGKSVVVLFAAEIVQPVRKVVR